VNQAFAFSGDGAAVELVADSRESAGAPPASLLSLPDPIWIVDFESNGCN
jgi:hypothetical protein